MSILTIMIFQNRVVYYVIKGFGITILHSPSTIRITHNTILYKYDCMNYE